MGLQKWLRTEDELNLFLTLNGLKPATEIDVEATGERCRVVEGYLSKRKAVYHRSEDYVGIRSDAQGEVKFARYAVGQDHRSLNVLLSSHTPQEYGRAFGYPDDAVEAVGKIVDGELRNGAQFLIGLARARRAGLELPSWLAYLDHVPAQLDLVRGEVSDSSLQVGRKYQAFVRATRRDLAARVEKAFEAMLLPDEWRLMPDGTFELAYTSIGFKP